MIYSLVLYSSKLVVKGTRLNAVAQVALNRQVYLSDTLKFCECGLSMGYLSLIHHTFVSPPLLSYRL